MNSQMPAAAAAPPAPPAPVPIVALDVPGASQALELAERLGDSADFYKVGLQLFTAAGPALVRELRAAGRRVFLDLKLHDIPNTVARAVESAATLGVELLTVHAAGGSAMLRAARAAAGERGAGGPQLFAVTVLTSLTAAEVAEAWGRPALEVEAEVLRLATLAHAAGADGVVASVQEAAALRAAPLAGLRLLTPGIRLAGSAAHDQARVATPAQAAALGVDYVVIGRAVTAAADPRAALEQVRRELSAPAGQGGAA